jgi:hypothetical protein
MLGPFVQPVRWKFIKFIKFAMFAKFAKFAQGNRRPTAASQ